MQQSQTKDKNSDCPLVSESTHRLRDERDDAENPEEEVKQEDQRRVLVVQPRLERARAHKAGRGNKQSDLFLVE